MNRMTCRKCAAPLPANAIFCHLCGVRQQGAGKPSRKPRTRPNGAGTAYKRGKTWTARVTLGWKTVEEDGKKKRQRVWQTKGGFPTKRDALAYCALMSTGGREKASRELTFFGVYEEWEEAYKSKITKSTLNCYRAAKKYFKDIYSLPFADVGLEDLQECVENCPKGKRTKENMKALAGLMYKYALPRHMTDQNYAQYLDTGTDTKAKRPAFTKEHIEIIKKSLGRVPYAEDIYCLIYTGFRPTELFSLTADSYNAELGYLIGGIKTDAGIDRPVTISPKIAEIIAKREKKASPYLFPRDDNKKMTAKYFRENYFYQALDAMGIQPIPTKESPAYYVPYSCRHTFSDLLKNVPGSDVDKAALMGHSDYDTTKKLYQSDDIASKRAITDKI